MIKYVWLAALIGAVACDSKSGDDSDDADGGQTTTTTTTYAQVAGVSTMIYDAVAAGEDVSPHIEAILEALGIPVLADDDSDGAQNQIARGLPFATTRLVEHMASAYAEGHVVGVEGYFKGLAEQKVELASPFNQTKTAMDDVVGAMLYSYVARAYSQPDVPLKVTLVLPSIVWSLGQERAHRAHPGVYVDSVWGDAQLDPLQFTLLTATIFAKPASAKSKTNAIADKQSPAMNKSYAVNPAAGFIKDQITDQIKGVVTGEIQDAVEVPLDEGDAAKVSICGSLILYGHKITMVNDPNLLWHAPLAPSLTKVTMTLTFEDDYYDNWARAVLGDAVKDLTGCSFPRKGPIEGKKVEWSVSDGLEDHGYYDLMQPVTDVDGKAPANWRTINRSVPPGCQKLKYQRDAVGATQTMVTGLLPGWSTVEAAVNFLNPNTGGQGNAPLTVLYYEPDATCHLE